MSSLLYFILFVFIAYYAFKFSMRLLLPYAMRKLTERMMKKAQQGQGGFTYTYGGSPFGQQDGNPFDNSRQQRANSTDGKIKVDFVPQQSEKRNGTATAGEFVDFEEVK